MDVMFATTAGRLSRPCLRSCCTTRRGPTALVVNTWGGGGGTAGEGRAPPAGARRYGVAPQLRPPALTCAVCPLWAAHATRTSQPQARGDRVHRNASLVRSFSRCLRPAFCAFDPGPPAPAAHLQHERGVDGVEALAAGAVDARVVDDHVHLGALQSRQHARRRLNGGGFGQPRAEPSACEVADCPPHALRPRHAAWPPHGPPAWSASPLAQALTAASSATSRLVSTSREGLSSARRFSSGDTRRAAATHVLLRSGLSSCFRNWAVASNDGAFRQRGTLHTFPHSAARLGGVGQQRRRRAPHARRARGVTLPHWPGDRVVRGLLCLF